MAAAAAAAARRGRDNRAGRGASNPASISNSPMAKLLRTNTVQLGNSNAAKQGQVKRYFPSFKSKSFSSMSKKVRPAKESINIPALLDGIDDGLSDDFKHMNTSMNIGPLKLKVIQPDSSWKNNYWDWIVILLVLYNSFFIPYNFSFLQKRNASIEMFDYLVDIVFLIDMGLSFFTGFYDKRGDEVLNLTAIRAKYMSGWFWIDFVAIFPFEILILMAGFNLETSIFNLFKAPRLLRLGKLAKKLDQLSGANVLRIFKLLLVFTLFAHWVACVWFFVGRFQDEGNLWIGSVWLVENDLCQTVKGPGNWVDGVYVQVPEDEVGTAYMVEGVEACIQSGEYAPDEHQAWSVTDQIFLDNSTKCVVGEPMPEFPEYCYHGIAKAKPDASVYTQFITSFYWALTTLTTIGYGDVTPSTNSERCFVIVVMLFGAILYASIFGNVAVLIQNFDAQHARYSRKLTEMNEYAQFYNFDVQTYERLLNYTAQHQSVGATIDLRSMLQDFPNSLKGDIAMAVHKEFVTALVHGIIPLRTGEYANFLRALAIQLRNTVILKGDYIFFKGEVNKEAYFMSKGYVGLVFDIKKKGDTIDEDEDPFKDPFAHLPMPSPNSATRQRSPTLQRMMTTMFGRKKEEETLFRPKPQNEVKVVILTKGNVFGNLNPLGGDGKCRYDALAVTKCELFSLPFKYLYELSRDYEPEMEIMCKYAEATIALKKKSFKSFCDVMPEEVQIEVEDANKRASLERSFGGKRNRRSSSIGPELTRAMGDLEAEMKDTEDRCVSRLNMVEKRLKDHVSKLKRDKKRYGIF